jgi:hypothetical protein
MSAEDQFESVPLTHETPRTASSSEALAPVVTAWLAGRLAVSCGEVGVVIAVLPGRWLFRVEIGGAASSLELPARGERGASEVAAAVRAWARGQGLAARIEPGHGEVRVVLAPSRC